MEKLILKVYILAGGSGTRLGEFAQEIPKPMVLIGGKPILRHIMSHYMPAIDIKSLCWLK